MGTKVVNGFEEGIEGRSFGSDMKYKGLERGRGRALVVSEEGARMNCNAEGGRERATGKKVFYRLLSDAHNGISKLDVTNFRKKCAMMKMVLGPE